MKPDYLRLLRCPMTKRELKLTNATETNGRIESGVLIEPVGGSEYPIVKFIPRFVSSDNYAANFGFEWNLHSRTQYDNHSSFSVSQDRFEREARWGSSLTGETILEAGSGSGRFTTHAADTGATVVSFDYSDAVTANYRSNGGRDNVLIVQADIFAMPFQAGSFDRAFCFGVLQHTPDPHRAFLELVDHVKAGGWLATDIYVKSFARRYLHTKYYARHLTKNIAPEKLYRLTKSYINFMWPLAKVTRRIPRIGPSINWRLLIADYSRELPDADDATLREWAYLDTFDMLSPKHDHPQTLRTFSQWHRDAGLTDIDVQYGYNGIEARARKPRGNHGTEGEGE